MTPIEIFGAYCAVAVGFMAFNAYCVGAAADENGFEALPGLVIVSAIWPITMPIVIGLTLGEMKRDKAPTPNTEEGKR